MGDAIWRWVRSSPRAPEMLQSSDGTPQAIRITMRTRFCAGQSHDRSCTDAGGALPSMASCYTDDSLKGAACEAACLLSGPLTLLARTWWMRRQPCKVRVGITGSSRAEKCRQHWLSSQSLIGPASKCVGFEARACQIRGLHTFPQLCLQCAECVNGAYIKRAL